MNSPRKNKKNIQVLIAEDDYLVSEMIKGLLEEIGYSLVGEAVNGSEAIEMVGTLQPDVVIMDIKMPDMNGLDAARHIHEECPTPVVVLTAYDTAELVEKASAAGIGAYLVKPSNARELERAITIAMARYNDMMDLYTLNVRLQNTLDKVKQLSGLLPICASCKNIRDDSGYWHRVEDYVRDRSEAEFSHGLCPDCMRKLYPEYYDDEEQE